MTLIALDDLMLLRKPDATDKTLIDAGGGLMIGVGRSGDDDYWAYRVQLTEKQAVIGFPKFGTIGVGFLVEQDWNSNLPYTTRPSSIADHIGHNRFVDDEPIPRAHVMRAIELIREAVGQDRGRFCRRCDQAGHWSEDCVLAPTGMDAYWEKDADERVRDDDGWPVSDDED